MSASQLFDWPTAKAALNVGWRVRRSQWTDRWLERWTGGLIWLILSDGTKRVVQNSDFGSSEFNAVDWTNLPPECVTSGTTAGTGTNGCPLPYTPTTANIAKTDPLPSTPVDPSDPPSGGFGAGQTGGGAGGNGSNTPRRDPQNITWPTISLTVQESNPHACYVHGNNPTDFVNPTFTGTVTLSAPSDYSGPGVLFVSVKNGPSTVATCTLGPNASYEFQWSDPLPVTPGSTLAFSARAWAEGAPDIQSSTSVDVLPWCDHTENWSYPPTNSGAWREYRPVTIASKTFANPFGQACSVTISGSADDDIYIENISAYLKGIGSAAGDQAPSGHTGHPDRRNNVSFQIGANESVSLSLIDTVGILTSCDITVRFH